MPSNNQRNQASYNDLLDANPRTYGGYAPLGVARFNSPKEAFSLSPELYQQTMQTIQQNYLQNMETYGKYAAEIAKVQMREKDKGILADHVKTSKELVDKYTSAGKWEYAAPTLLNAINKFTGDAKIEKAAKLLEAEQEAIKNINKRTDYNDMERMAAIANIKSDSMNPMLTDENVHTLQFQDQVLAPVFKFNDIAFQVGQHIRPSQGGGSYIEPFTAEELATMGMAGKNPDEVNAFFKERTSQWTSFNEKEFKQIIKDFMSSHPDYKAYEQSLLSIAPNLDDNWFSKEGYNAAFQTGDKKIGVIADLDAKIKAAADNAYKAFGKGSSMNRLEFKSNPYYKTTGGIGGGRGGKFNPEAIRTNAMNAQGANVDLPVTSPENAAHSYATYMYGRIVKPDDTPKDDIIENNLQHYLDSEANKWTPEAKENVKGAEGFTSYELMSNYFKGDPMAATKATEVTATLKRLALITNEADRDKAVDKYLEQVYETTTNNRKNQDLYKNFPETGKEYKQFEPAGFKNAIKADNLVDEYANTWRHYAIDAKPAFEGHAPFILAVNKNSTTPLDKDFVAQTRALSDNFSKLTGKNIVTGESIEQTLRSSQGKRYYVYSKDGKPFTASVDAFSQNADINATYTTRDGIQVVQMMFYADAEHKYPIMQEVKGEQSPLIVYSQLDGPAAEAFKNSTLNITAAKWAQSKTRGEETMQRDAFNSLYYARFAELNGKNVLHPLEVEYEGNVIKVAKSSKIDGGLYISWPTGQMTTNNAGQQVPQWASAHFKNGLQFANEILDRDSNGQPYRAIGYTYNKLMDLYDKSTNSAYSNQQ